MAWHHIVELLGVSHILRNELGGVARRSASHPSKKDRNPHGETSAITPTPLNWALRNFALTLPHPIQQNFPSIKVIPRRELTSRHRCSEENQAPLLGDTWAL
jgi:hypothetical protein